MDAKIIGGINVMGDVVKEDLINHPKHYADSCSLECIEAMEICFGLKELIQYCKFAAFKYIWRYKAKGGKEDLEKAKWYLDYIDTRVVAIYGVKGDNPLLTNSDREQIVAMQRYYYKVINGVN